MSAEFRPDPDGDDLPPPPEKPDPLDCCGGGCAPCIYDLYEEELIEWQKQVAEIKARRQRGTDDAGA